MRMAGVTVRDDDGRDHGMTVNAFSSVSLVPPLVLVCIDRAASSHNGGTEAARSSACSRAQAEIRSLRIATASS